MKDKAEERCEGLRKEMTELQSEITTLKNQLKSSKRRVHQLQMSESQIPGIKANFDREQASFQQEMVGLKRLLEATQDQLKREAGLRQRTEHEILTAKKGMCVWTGVWSETFSANGVYDSLLPCFIEIIIFFFLSLSLSLSLSHTHTHSLSLSHTHTHTHTLSLSLSSFPEIDNLQTRLNDGETDAAFRQRELTKTVKLNNKLRNELRLLNEHIAANMVSRIDFDYYKKLIDEKVIV